MDRRRFIAGSLATLSLPEIARVSASAAPSPAASPAAEVPAGEAVAFDPEVVRRKARQLAAAPFKEPDKSLPKELQKLTYDAYRSIRFWPQRALWRDEKLPFQVQFFHRGWIFNDRVEIYEVSGGKARPILYSPSLFDFGQVDPPSNDPKIGFAGFRIHAPMNRPDYYDEVGVFLGASYFRAVAKGEVYGLSARGLSIGTGDSSGEEFPAFTTFWIEKPQPRADSIVVHALLDSKSTAGAFRFTIRPGTSTVYDSEVTLYPRNDITQVGIGSLTSMFFFAANDRNGIDDFRPAVHDSDGLAINNGHGEEIWRPLANPRDLQISVFSDVHPRGFGLMQRERRFHAYEDLESHFEKRPSAWVEPIGDWGEGAVHLVEIPSNKEINDNIVAFWRPKAPLKAKGEFRCTYRLYWGNEKPHRSPLARFVATRIGAGPNGTRRIVLDATGELLKAGNGEHFRAAAAADKGEIRHLVVQSNPVTGGQRVSFELATKGQPLIELRVQLLRNDEPVSETWIYRWTS